MPASHLSSPVRTTTSRTARYSGDQRRALSCLGALLYVLSAIVLPSLHVGFHRDDHEHRGGGLKLLHGVLGEHPHQHLAGPSQRVASYREADDEQPAELHDPDTCVATLAVFQTAAGGVARDPQSPRSRAAASSVERARLTVGAGHLPHGPPAADPTHGDGSLAHFASAFLPSAAPAALPLAGPLLTGPRFFSPADRAPHSAFPSTKDARGPPAPVAA